MQKFTDFNFETDMLVMHNFGLKKENGFDSEDECKNLISNFMQKGFLRPRKRCDKKHDDQIFFSPCTKLPDKNDYWQYFARNKNEKMRARDNCEMLIQMYFDSSRFYKKGYNVYVVYRIPKTYKLGINESFQWQEDGVTPKDGVTPEDVQAETKKIDDGRFLL